MHTHTHIHMLHTQLVHTHTIKTTHTSMEMEKDKVCQHRAQGCAASQAALAGWLPRRVWHTDCTHH
jgi:hypothetical protein